MFTCPHCRTDLVREQIAPGVFWDCPACHGRAVGLALLRQLVDPRYVREAWALASVDSEKRGLPCAVCLQQTAHVTVDLDGRHPQLDVCLRCAFTWFEAGEYEQLPPPPSAPHVLGDIDELKLPMEVREALALTKAQELAEQAKREDDGDYTWKDAPALFGFPVERDVDPLQHMPWGTYLMTAIIAAVSLAAWISPDFGNLVKTWGFIPSQPWRVDGATFLTSFFLHANALHLAGNLYFFVIFGRHVEDYLGRGRWFVTLLLATLAGDFFEMLLRPDGQFPCIGASGGISGLLAFYALKFPHAQLGILLSRFFYFRLVRIPAWGAFSFWIFFQFIGAYEETQHVSSVASIAHLGGCLAGLAGWLLWRNFDATPKTPAFNSPLVITRR